ncbi:MAG: hypothetical protein AAF602_32480 [Myxococcota bacterium]
MPDHLLQHAATLAYRPFIDPLPIDGVHPLVWYALFPPMVVAVCVVYKAVRAWNMRTFWRQVAGLAGSIIAGMLVIGVLTLWILAADVTTDDLADTPPAQPEPPQAGQSGAGQSQSEAGQR